MQISEANERASAGQALLATITQYSTNTMSWPLLPIATRVKKQGWPAMWLPLILLWPPILALFCLALPVCAWLSTPRRTLFAALSATYQLLCALHGTEVEVADAEHGSWTISLY